MINIKATIQLYKGSGFLQNPILTGYRPLFNFISTMKTSGQISLLGRDKLFPGEEAVVFIQPLSEEFLGDCKAGSKFTFGEGRKALGEGEVIEIVST
jgi:hypothetical protein